MGRKKYINNQIKWMKYYVDAENTSVRRAVDKVETTNTAKFEAQNEWRQQFKDQAGTFMTRRELWIISVAIAGFILTIFFKK